MAPGDSMTSDVSRARNPDSYTSLNCEVMVFKDINYHGAAEEVWPGRYDVDFLPLGNDAISSLVVPPGWKVTLFADELFEGATQVLTASDGSLVDNSFNDKASSILVEG